MKYLTRKKEFDCLFYIAYMMYMNAIICTEKLSRVNNKNEKKNIFEDFL